MPAFSIDVPLPPDNCVRSAPAKRPPITRKARFPKHPNATPQIDSPSAAAPTPSKPPSAGRNATERLLKIHQILSAARFPNSLQLARQFEVAEKTIKRDIQWMKVHWDAPIEYDHVRHGYFYTRPAGNFPGVLTVTESEMISVLFFHQAIEQYQATPFHQHLQAALQKLVRCVSPNDACSIHDFENILSFRSFAPEITDLERFQAVLRALQTHRVLRFEYRKPGELKSHMRCVHPYHLTCVENTWYLIGFDQARSTDRTFALARICGPVFVGDKFEKPENFSVKDYLNGSLTILKGQADFHILIQFDAWAADLVRARKWHHSQRVEPLPNGSCHLRLRLSALEEVERWVLSWGTHATVIEPPALVQRIASAARDLAKRYPQ